jgi:hypothetical protein
LNVLADGTHLARKLADAEDIGSIGWQGRRGHSVMWVSAGFRREYATAQATKLAIIDTAFSACFRQIPVAALAAMPAMPVGNGHLSENRVN